MGGFEARGGVDGPEEEHCGGYMFICARRLGRVGCEGESGGD
jgi:hypothetical protein